MFKKTSQDIENTLMILKNILPLSIIKFLSFLGMIAAAAWFFMAHDFAAVLTGILCLAAFMIAFLPVNTDQQI